MNKRKTRWESNQSIIAHNYEKERKKTSVLIKSNLTNKVYKRK